MQEKQFMTVFGGTRRNNYDNEI